MCETFVEKLDNILMDIESKITINTTFSYTNVFINLLYFCRAFVWNFCIPEDNIRG